MYKQDDVANSEDVGEHCLLMTAGAVTCRNAVADCESKARDRMECIRIIDICLLLLW